MGSVVSIARNLGARRQGHNWRCACPLDCGYGVALSEGENGLLVHCFGGCDYHDILAVLVEHGLLDNDDIDPDASRRVHEAATRSAEDVQYRIDAACWLYRQAKRDKMIGIYLRSRAIPLVPPILRFCGHTPHRLGSRCPAMLAPITDVVGDQIGTHITFLRAGSQGKAHLPKEYQRETRGLARGGAIRLAPHIPGRALVLAEGIETALSAMVISKMPAWSVVYAANLQTVELPRTAQHVIVAVDNDASGTGMRNALAARAKWIAEGRRVHLARPPEVGTDFNDLLVERGRK